MGDLADNEQASEQRVPLSMEIALSGAAQCQIPVLSTKLVALSPL